MQNTFAILGAALLLGLASAVPTPAAAPADAPTNASTAWPQFHGPGASGVAADDHAVPLPFGRDTNLLWTTSIPVGHSSACIYGDRIFITGFLPESKTMETLGLDRATGKVLWRREVKPDKIEKVHRISHPVTSTPATDGRSVFVYFGSYGLIAYDFEGGLRWERRLPSPVIFLDFGSGTSPIVAGDKVIVDIQNGADSHVLAVNVTNGATFWKADKPTARGWSTPIVWHEGALDCVGVFNASRFTAYNLKDGQERWWVSALPNQVCATPVVGNGMLYLNGTGVYGESDNLVSPPAFKEALALYDKDKDGLISAEEIPKTALYVDRRNSQQSGNQRLRDMLFPRAKATDRMDEKDWDAAVGRLKSFSTSSMMSSAVLAIRSGGQGDVTSSHAAWTQTKGVPEVPSPLLYRDRLYFVKNGGVLLCRNPQTGQVLFEERLGGGGGYFASPVGGGGFIYLASDLGVVTVCAAGDGLKVTSQADLKEPIFATPALASGRLYVRTKQHLMAFGQ